MNIWRALTKQHLDIEFLATKDTKAFIYERPGSWMTDADLAELVDDLRTVASKTLPKGSLRYGVLGGDKNRLKNCIILYISFAADKGQLSRGRRCNKSRRSPRTRRSTSCRLLRSMPV